MRNVDLILYIYGDFHNCWGPLNCYTNILELESPLHGLLKQKFKCSLCRKTLFNSPVHPTPLRSRLRIHRATSALLLSSPYTSIDFSIHLLLEFLLHKS